MKKYFLFAAFLFLFQITAFSQQLNLSNIDIPNWVKPGMSADELIKTALKFKIVIEHDEDDCYEYIENELIYHLDVDPVVGLYSFWIYATENILNYNRVVRHFNQKYERADDDEDCWEFVLDGTWDVIIALYSGNDKGKIWNYIEYSFFDF